MHNIKYKIIKVWPDVRGVDVHFFTECNPTGRITHIQFQTDIVPTGKALDDYIFQYAPVEEFAHHERCKEKADMRHVEKLVGVVKERNLRAQSAIGNIDVVQDDELVPGEFLAGKIVI